MQFAAFKPFYEKHIMNITLAVMVLGLLFVFLSPTMIVTIPSGHLGVRWYRFNNGTDLGPAIREGTRLKFPWDELYDYDARAQIVDQDYDVITKDGLLVATKISFLYRVKPDTLGLLHKEVGPDFVKEVLKPELGAVARSVISHYTAEELYSTHREEAQDKILQSMIGELYEDNAYSPNGVVLIAFDRLMLKSIKLPERIASAIEAKVEQFQRQLEYDFRLQIETKEKQRKSIEGEGVRALFDNIGGKDLASYLRLSGINATLELARSNNAKIIVTGSSLNALPLLIGSDTVTPTTPPTQAGEAAKTDINNEIGKSLQPFKAPTDQSQTTPSRAEKSASNTDKTKTDGTKK
ncbi:prohibitin family protein [Methylomonas albis]|uniref:Prohibitin family protein n=1 Tax=Methylomonas albis TaxID=1854563 RepID=A0ABR9D4H5_9GAMM|nr:prohibitin family protein [Methylomonas albis]MBD9358037.1 prohibitin family protein [Methylomonas albis]